MDMLLATLQTSWSRGYGSLELLALVGTDGVAEQGRGWQPSRLHGPWKRTTCPGRDTLPSTSCTQILYSWSVAAEGVVGPRHMLFLWNACRWAEDSRPVPPRETIALFGVSLVPAICCRLTNRDNTMSTEHFDIILEYSRHSSMPPSCHCVSCNSIKLPHIMTPD